MPIASPYHALGHFSTFKIVYIGKTFHKSRKVNNTDKKRGHLGFSMNAKKEENINQGYSRYLLQMLLNTLDGGLWYTI